MRVGLSSVLCALAMSLFLRAGPVVADSLADDRGGQDGYLAELISAARAQQLSRDPVWLALLHYKPGWWHHFVSEVDGPDFFLAAQGKTDPQAELEATLAGFFSNRTEPLTGLTAQCRFRARFHWLQQRLGFDKTRLKIADCPEYAAVQQEINAGGLSVIFPNSDPNNPAAMMGHTLLRMDRRDQTERTRMLAHSVNYAALVGEINGLVYAWKGVTGGFQGRFSVVPYYLKLRDYQKIKNRDLWEYRLRLDQAQVDFILMHIYELQPSWFDYYFFSENCSYHVLSLLDVITPEQRLTGQVKPWVAPVDTLRLLDERGMIGEVSYYPAPQTVLKQKLAALDAVEIELVQTIVADGLAAGRARLESHAAPRQAAMLDLAYDYHRYLRMTEGSGLDPAVSAEERQLLLARSRLGISTPPDTPPARPPRPERGHDTSRLSLGGGRVEDQSFLHLGWRAAYHDFLDPTAGFTLHNRIEVFKLGFRYEQQAEAMEFDELQLLDITSLTPRDVFFKDISWHLRAGWLNRLQQDGGREKVFSLSGGGGLAWAFEWPQQTILYGFADIAVNFADIYMKGRLDQWGGSAGLLMQINPVWKLHLSGSELHDSRDRLPVERRITLEQGFRLGRDLALRLSVSRISWLVHESSPGRASDEAVLSLHFYH